MSERQDRFFRNDGNDAVAATLAQVRRRRVWHFVVGANIVAVIAVAAGCLFMTRTQGVKVDVSRMRDEVGESLTMMSLGGANEAVSRHLPRLAETTARWYRKFAVRSESFRGLDVEIDQVHMMVRLGGLVERWRREMEDVSPMQRNELWNKSIKAQVEAEQKKWPNRTHRKGLSEWARDWWKEFWFGLNQGFAWPVGLYQRTAEMIRGGLSMNRLGPGDRLRYILFPYRLSAFTMLRLAGIAISTSAIGYLMCWIGLKSRFGWLSYCGLVYFFYLLNIALFIVYLEVFE